MVCESPLITLAAINCVPSLLPVAPFVGEGVTPTVGVLAGIAVGVGVTVFVGVAVGVVCVGVADGDGCAVELAFGVGLTGTGVWLTGVGNAPPVLAVGV